MIWLSLKILGSELEKIFYSDSQLTAVQLRL